MRTTTLRASASPQIGRPRSDAASPTRAQPTMAELTPLFRLLQAGVGVPQPDRPGFVSPTRRREPGLDEEGAKH